MNTATHLVWKTMAGTLLALALTQAVADSLPVGSYSYRAQNAPLSDVLDAFSAHYRLSGVTSECLKESFNGHLKADSGEAFLNKLSSAYNFVWFSLDSTIYFNCPSEIQTKLITLNRASPTRFSEKMAQIGLDLNRFGMRILPNTSMILLSGPPKFLEIAMDAAKGVDDLASQASNHQMKPYVVPLYYSNADDRELDNGKIDPGMVTKLRDLLGYDDENAQGNIVADSSANSVLIYDTDTAVQRILPLIQTLDRSQRQIEISVSIIDIAEGAMEDIGVNWKAHGPHGNISVDPVGGLIEGLWHGGTGIATTLPNYSVNKFEFALTALEQQNKAKTLSKPTLLAKENTRAVISNKEEFYAKVEAKEDAQLITLYAGTELVVIPRIVPSPEGLSISLDITLTDGRREEETVSDLPVVKSSTIVTQATVNRGQSLLIGGFYTQRNSNSTSKIPLLGDIPFLGRMFRYDSSNDGRNVRMFLIRPRILEQRQQDQGGASASFEPSFNEDLPEIVALREAINSIRSD